MKQPGDEVISAYRALEAQAARMVALLRSDDWPAILGEGEHYVAAVTALAALENNCELDADARATKYALLERTLNYDLEIRARLMECREELSRQIARSRHRRATAGTYGAVGIATAHAPVPEPNGQP
ncbi:MAG TPA: flagellar protein FliT [Rhodanobacteraceae bacterium]|nr:flagellar protein FliT [Rhodanobacteraceae bacterium]